MSRVGAATTLVALATIDKVGRKSLLAIAGVRARAADGMLRHRAARSSTVDTRLLLSAPHSHDDLYRDGNLRSFTAWTRHR